MRILLVDDEEIIHHTVGAFLRDFGHEVVSAKDGSEALTCLGEHDFDLIFSDIRMPVIGGLQLLETVQKRFPGTPIVLMTGCGDENTTETALALGALAFPNKPVGLRDFTTYIDRVAADQEKPEN